jgi:hypothetical protein
MPDILRHLLQSIRGAAVHNPDVQAPPQCILWPDGDRQWEPAVARLRAEMPEIFTLGDYDVEAKRGPAIWLRCVIASKLPGIDLPSGLPPILYLPGISRQDLRAVESCPDTLKPIAELQYSGVLWSQVNAKDWTILAFLKSDQGGLGLDVAQDNESRHAMQLALYRLLDEDVELLRGKRLDKDYFNTLLTGGDPVRDLLQWLNQGDAFKAARDANAWAGFVEVSKSQLAFDPDNDGGLKGAELLATHKGPWLSVWERFCEAPKRYSNIPVQIRKCQAPSDTIFWLTDDGTFDGWPQWNQDHEKGLGGELRALANLPAHDARRKLLDLESRHGRRRSLVWAELGESPLASAMESLATLARVTEANPLTAGTANEVAERYRASAWRADDAVLKALQCVDRLEDFEAIKAAIRAVYLPWAEDAARYLQVVVRQNGYPGIRDPRSPRASPNPGECIFFVDGLRLDAGRRLSEILQQHGLSVRETAVWSALPSVTATAKPAVTPVAHLIVGQDANADFEPCVASSGQSGAYYLRKVLAEQGWQLHDQSGNEQAKSHPVKGPAWCESGAIDHEGHDRGAKLAKHLDSVLAEVTDRIGRLFAEGFDTVRVVTDHGWLLMPGGLPKTNLPSSLTENAWGRCAALKPGAHSDEHLYPWYWNPHQEFALADGISCYRGGIEYTHGGLSVQECLTIHLTITQGNGLPPGSTVQITDISWKGLRCRVALDGDTTALSLDLRLQAGNPKTTVVMGVKPFKDGTSSVVVEEEDLEGVEATIVVLDSSGRLVAQRQTMIAAGGE